MSDTEIRDAQHEEAGKPPPLFGVSGEFATPRALLEAVRALRAGGFGRIDAYSPVPVDGITEALAEHPAGLEYAIGVQPAAALGAVLGGIGFYAVMVYATAYDYVFNIGGRPVVSWPSYVIPAFSLAMLTGTGATLLAMLFFNRLPRLSHPAFGIPDFARASADRFFVCVEAGDGFDPDAVERRLAALPEPPLAVHRVPR